jgi:hypothetical protein
MKYTFLYHKKDLRSKDGERTVYEVDFDIEPELLSQVVDFTNKELSSKKCFKNVRLEVIETMVTRKNYMTGEYFKERWDTPYFSSASSESFWSN